MYSLKKRLEFRLVRMRHDTAVAQLALAQAVPLAEREDEPPLEVECGHDSYTESLNYYDW